MYAQFNASGVVAFNGAADLPTFRVDLPLLYVRAGLDGAELNAEIEHSSPYGKDVGEKVKGGKGAFTVDGRMVDAPVIIRARRILSL